MTLKEQYDSFCIWLKIFNSVNNGGVGLMYFDALGLPVDGFKENYKSLIRDGHTHYDAWKEATIMQFEKLIDKQLKGNLR